MKDKEKQTKVFDILDKIEFFQGQRAGRELWNNKPKEIQDKDIADFIKDIKYIRAYLQDSVVLSKEEAEELRKEIITLSQELVNSRKETAEKIIREIIDKLIARKAIVKSFYSISESVGVDMAIDEVKKLAKQLGVEIKE